MAIVAPIDWKRASWEEACEAVTHFRDALGSEVDEGIFETVVCLNLLGFPTWQSCEGHLDHGAPYPWITFVQRDLDQTYRVAWKHVCSLQDEAESVKSKEAYDRYLAADHAFRIRLAEWKQCDTFFFRLCNLLDAFYQNEVSSPTRLMVNRYHPGTYRVEMGRSRLVDGMSLDLKALYLKQSQAEMAAFTAYLKKQVRVPVSCN